MTSTLKKVLKHISDRSIHDKNRAIASTGFYERTVNAEEAETLRDSLKRLNKILADVAKQHKWMQRITVARDVIAQLTIEKYRAKTGSYVRNLQIDNRTYDDGDYGFYDIVDVDAKSSLHRMEKCDVCAIGACIISITKFKNKLKWGEILRHSNFDKQGTVVTNMLSEVFSPYQLALIEAAFEGGFNNTGHSRVARELGVCELEQEDEIACVKFHKNSSDTNNRLKNIMQNIIDNKGTFKP